MLIQHYKKALNATKASVPKLLNCPGSAFPFQINKELQAKQSKVITLKTYNTEGGYPKTLKVPIVTYGTFVPFKTVGYA